MVPEAEELALNAIAIGVELQQLLVHALWNACYSYEGSDHAANDAGIGFSIATKLDGLVYGLMKIIIEASLRLGPEEEVVAEYEGMLDERLVVFAIVILFQKGFLLG